MDKIHTMTIIFANKTKYGVLHSISHKTPSQFIFYIDVVIVQIPATLDAYDKRNTQLLNTKNIDLVQQ